jgi:hypothetical protein
MEQFPVVVSKTFFASVLLLPGLLMSCNDTAYPRSATAASDFIGTAEIDEQGVLTLDLVARGPDAIGHLIAVYRPGEPRYDEVLRHIGAIRPGEIKPVRAWPSPSSER